VDNSLLAAPAPLRPNPSVVVIINPVSGPKRRGGPAERVQLAQRTFDRLGIDGDIRLTERRHHAHELAREAVQAGARLVVAWGGDGTINEVARALANSATSLGIIPGGSGNGLSRELKIPFDPPSALERALQSDDRIIDAGELDGRMFFNIAGIGLDAHVAGNVAARVHHRGLIPYLLASSKDLWKFRAAEYSIETDAGSFETRALIVAIANSPQYGFGARVAPQALRDDGLLDLVVIEDRRFVRNVLRVPSLFLGSFARQAGVRVSKVRYARIRGRSPMLLHVDGEPIATKMDVVARVHAAALRVRA
jgi:YegS/Rv2252/BmrU family lipid kinase